MPTRQSSVRVAAPWLARPRFSSALLFAAKISHKMPDFAVYWTAASRARAAEPLYRADDGHYQFKYLPAFAILTTPLARVPLQTAKALWFVASVVLVGPGRRSASRFCRSDGRPAGC